MRTRHCRKGPLFTALHDYHHASKTAIVKVLLEHGSGSGRGVSAGRTYPLQRAIEDGVEIATLPVEYGADGNAVAERQGLPLYLAMKQKSAPLGWCDSYRRTERSPAIGGRRRSTLSSWNIEWLLGELGGKSDIKDKEIPVDYS